MLEETAFKMEGFLTFKGSWPWLDRGSGHTAYRRASVIDIYPHAKCHLSRRNFLLTEVRRTDRRTFETHFIRSTQKRRPKNVSRRGTHIITDRFFRCASRWTNMPMYPGLKSFRPEVFVQTHRKTHTADRQHYTDHYVLGNIYFS